jgi:hypothetical protein
MNRNLFQACFVIFAAIIIGTILTMDGYELFGRLEGQRAISKSIERRKAVREYDSSTFNHTPPTPVSGCSPLTGIK